MTTVASSLPFAVMLLAAGMLAQHEVPGEVLVGPAQGHAAALPAAVRGLGLEVAETDAVSGVLRVRVPVGSETRWIAALAARHDIAYAERNGIGGGGLVPDDPSFPAQWHLRNTGQGGGRVGADVAATGAWDITTGSASVVVAVLDTGLHLQHPEFAGRIDPDGWDFVNEDNDPTADHSHGTEVSGMLCANGDDGLGVAGIDWQCKVLPIKVLDQFNAGTVMDLAQGLNYVATQPDVQIVSMSLINYPGSTTLLNALAVASSAGKILVACAGNGGMGNADISFPGASPLTISIGATNNTDARAAFSGTGVRLDFVAPGANVVTCNANVPGQTSTVSGCSFATPLTAGVVALLLARAQTLGLPLPDQTTVYEALRAGARDQVGPANEDPPGRDHQFGHGRVDALASLLALPSALCGIGNVGAGAGGPFAVVRVAGSNTRRVRAPANMAFPVTVDAPPSNPPNSPLPPFFALLGKLGDTSADLPVALPLGLGLLCFDPASPTVFASLAGVAPWTTSMPALAPGFVASLQGALFDTPQGHIGVTNLVTFETRSMPPPVVTAVTPPWAMPGQPISVSGAGFLAGLTLQVNGTTVVPTSVSATTIVFPAPVGVPCNAPLLVTNPDAQSASRTVNASPVVTNVVLPTGAPAAGGTLVYLIGSNFVNGTTVTVGGAPMVLQSTTASLLVGTLPPGVPGPAAVVVTTPFGCSGQNSLTYTP